MSENHVPYTPGMTLMPGQSTSIGVGINMPTNAMPSGSFQMQDISNQVFGKYQFCTDHWGLTYADSDFIGGDGCGPLKWGALPDPWSPDRRPWRGVIVELIRRAMGAKRAAR